MARGLNGNGVAVAVVGYDLCPVVTIADIVEQIRRACIYLWQRFERPMVASGHSAGGHLAAAMVATDWPSIYPKAPAELCFIRRILEGDLAEPQARAKQVDVAIVESRNNPAALRIDDARPWSDELADGTVAADGQDSATPHG